MHAADSTEMTAVFNHPSFSTTFCQPTMKRAVETMYPAFSNSQA